VEIRGVTTSHLLPRATRIRAGGQLHPSVRDLAQENDWVSVHVDNMIVATMTVAITIVVVVITTVPVMIDVTRIFLSAQA
jgi:hypothetical protein